ncbi:MAG: DUF1573 domain-containing protein [Chthonomonadales bacterium]|nr:DUF1573 domain-containing protein [Chthonomonadales bacterium]
MSTVTTWRLPRHAPRAALALAALVCLAAAAPIAWRAHRRAAPGAPEDCGCTRGTAAAALRKPASGPLAPASATYRFGTVAAGAIVRHRFALRNTSGRPLTVIGVTASCSCTSARVLEPEVPAGGRAVVEVTYMPSFDLKGTYRDSRRADVYVRGHDGPVASVTVEATVRCSVMASAAEVAFGEVRSGSARERTVTLTVDRHERVRLEPAAGAARRFTRATLSPPRAGANGARVQTLRVAVLAGAPVGELKAEIGLKAQGGTRVSLPVTATVVGPVTADPDILFFADVRRGEPASLTFALRAAGAERCRVRSLRSDSPYVAARLAAGSPETMVEVTVTDRAPTGELRAHVVVRFEGSAAVVDVPVFARVE